MVPEGLDVGLVVRLSGPVAKGDLVSLVWPDGVYKETARVLAFDDELLALRVPLGYVETYEVET